METNRRSRGHLDGQPSDPPRRGRLRRDEPREPLPGVVRRARRSGELIRLAAAGVSYQDLAHHFGYVNPATVRSRITTDRDRLPPSEPFPSPHYEVNLASQLSDVLSAEVWRCDVEQIAVFQDAVGVVIDLLDWKPVRWVPPQFCEGTDPGPVGAVRGEWTRGLELRSQGRSFHDIADACGVEDTFDAVVMVTHDLDAYRRESVTRLRAQQVNDIDTQLDRLWPLATHLGRVPFRLARTVLNLIEQRARIRGLRYRHTPGNALAEVWPTNEYPTEEGSSR